MFRRSIVVVPTLAKTEYVTREVREHRAPTDQSVALLREMEEKARAQIVDSIHVGNSAFECVVHTMRHFEDQSTSWMAIFSLNGKKMTVTHREQDWRCSKDEALRKLRDLIAEKITNEVLTFAFTRG